MENIILFDPGIRSLNKGDEIIMRSAEKEIERILKNNYVIKCGTHTPVVTFYQNTRFNPRSSFYEGAKYKFICGSSLIWKNMFKPRPTFNVNWFNCRAYKNSILYGCGIGQVKSKGNYYTKKLYDMIFSKKYVHSVRDNKAKEFVESIGDYKAINTGCPTMWRLDKDFCKDITSKKADGVVFTLTDYSKNKSSDKLFLKILEENYKNIYFYPQGAYDLEYLKSITDMKGIRIVSPDVNEYSRFLNQNDVDYVGTRLHGGLFAMQHKKRV